MALKAKIKFKPVHPDGSQDDNDVIIIKVKRNNWPEFSRLLGAGRAEAHNWHIEVSDAGKIEDKFDEVKSNY